MTFEDGSIVKLKWSSRDQLNVLWVVLAFVLKRTKSCLSCLSILIPIVRNYLNLFCRRVDELSLKGSFLLKFLDEEASLSTSPDFLNLYNALNMLLIVC